MPIKEQFFDLWARRSDKKDPDTRKEIEQEMINTLKIYIERNYKFLENQEEMVRQLKSDFESEIPNNILMEATGVDRKVCRRFRYHEGRGVIDKRPDSSRNSIPPSTRKQVEKRDDNSCVKCGFDNELSIHHIIPLSHGGINGMDNFALLCKSCHKEAHNGNFGTRRMAYETKDEFWEEFCNDS